MNNKKCYIFGAGDAPEIFPKIEEDSLVIAADGGFAYLFEQGVSPDVVIGDFDSLPHDKRADITCEIITLPVEKDMTDMAAAVDKGIENGCTDFHIYGGSGGKRTDHTIANLRLLYSIIKRGFSAKMYSNDEVFTAVINGEIHFDANSVGTVSVFSLSEVSYGVNERGLKYSLTDYTMRYENSVGVSNEFIGKESSISVREGALLIIYTNH